MPNNPTANGAANAAPISLLEFLIANPINNFTEELYVSPRFKTAGYKFKITAMSGEQFSRYQQEAIAVGRHRNVRFDSKTFQENIVLNHTVEPNFRDEHAVKSAGCRTPQEFLYKVLLAGEISELSNAISSLSGFDKDPEDEKDSIKNF